MSTNRPAFDREFVPTDKGDRDCDCDRDFIWSQSLAPERYNSRMKSQNISSHVTLRRDAITMKPALMQNLTWFTVDEGGACVFFEE
jgi:hypothetical protein